VATDTTTPGTGQAEQGDNWEQRYLGLQRVLSKKDLELAEARGNLNTRQAQVESDLAELREIRAARAAENEEQAAQERAEFAEFQRRNAEPPMPLQHSDLRSPTAPDTRDYKAAWPV
jgi:septal ring factor EnvC (AmiA/AmiB activator)